MRREITEQAIVCPHCGERITVLLDSSVPEQQYVEDCQVCCRPMTLLVTSLDGRDVSISVHNDLE
ncbi:MAG TPA: CPXCG motif-containing cysteine-rich protein [Woeseiaceae bacterium]